MGLHDLSGSQKGNTRTTYGYTFQLTEDHLTAEQMLALQHSYDELGNEALEILDKISPPAPPRAGWGVKKGVDDEKIEPQPNRDLYTLLRDNAEKNDVLKKLWDQVNTVPEWVDWEQIKRGQKVFYRHAAPALTGFAFQGLFGTTASARRPGETLVRTGGHSAKVARHRFFETFQLLLQVTQSIEAVKPGGAGHASTVRVRFLHASVRQRIMKLTSQRPTYYNLEKWGPPINDLDSIHSLCAFSCNLVWLGLPRQGIYLRKQEAADYVALWRWVGHVIGAPTWALETPQKAHATMQSLMYESMHPTDNTRVLAQNIVKALDGVPPIYASKEYLEAGGRWFNGNELCDEIGLGTPRFYYRMLMAGQCLMFMVISYGSLFIPYFDDWKIAAFRKLLWDYIVEGKEGLGGGTMFDFKYVPQLDEKTGVEFTEEAGKTSTGIERLALYAVIFVCVISTLTGFLGIKAMLYFVK